MRTSFYRNISAAMATLLLFVGVQAQAATWALDPGESQVFFKYSYKGTPYQGEFKNVEATFKIDPMSPSACDFSVTIPIADISLDSDEAKDYLLDIELFDVDQFPTATFKATKCRLESGSAFVADGSLTIRNKTNPISFPFNLDIEVVDGQVRFHLTSEVTIQRLAFDVGQGYWANTAEIPNDVVVSVDVYAGQQ
ncbi:YceI family protein [Aurantivibrio infirmus]